MIKWYQLVPGVLAIGLGVVFFMYRAQLAEWNAKRVREMFGIVGESLSRFSHPFGIVLSGVIFLVLGVIAVVQSFI